LGARLGVRDTRNSFYTLAPDARLALRFDDWRLSLAASFERGSATRELGETRAEVWSTGAGVGRRVALATRFAIDADAQVDYVYAALSPTSSDVNVVSTPVRGSAAQAAMVVSPRVMFDLVHLGLSLHAGYTVPRVRGAVSGDASVILDGPWYGVGAFVGLPLAP
jgi:hypothetical protein